VSDEQGQRVLQAIAEAAYQGQQAHARRDEARRLRGAPNGAAPSSYPGRRGPRVLPPPNPGPQGSTVIADPALRAASLCGRAAAVQAHTREILIKARMICGAVRVMREDRHASGLPEASLPPLDFVLYSVIPRPLGLDLENPPAWLAQRLIPPTTLYVWGYKPPESTLCRDQCQPSEAAEQFAARGGWDPRRPGAWAKETTVLQRLTDARRKLEPTIRQDGGVVGWGMRTARCSRD